MTTLETKTEPVEVRLSQPDLEVTCRIVFPGGTVLAVGVDSLSILSAQSEVTAWLTERGCVPAGRWSTDKARQTARAFRWPGQAPCAAAGPARRPAAAVSPHRGPDPGPPRMPGSAAAPQRRHAAKPGATAGRGPEGSPLTAESELREWARVYLRRDEVIRAAAAAGVKVRRIHEVTGLARTTILRILSSPPRPVPRRIA